MTQLFLAVFLATFPMFVSAELVRCNNNDNLAQILSFGDVFLGEMHGTAEVPIFLQCLVETALKASPENIVVSLELSEDARNLSSAFWTVDAFEDGRSSVAMFELVSFLLEQERQQLLTLHFQHGQGRNSARAVGDALKQLSLNAQVIALAGNSHSRKNDPNGDLGNIKTEGMFVGPGFTHIMLAALNGGEGWNCPGRCGVSAIGSWPGDSGKNGELADGSRFGHDYIYFMDVERFTASEPMDIGEAQ